MEKWDVVIVGAGAAGLFCAIEAGRRGRRVLVIDHAEAAGEKIRISGGGRCNFTNLNTAPERFLSNNPHFCISALRRFTPRDFVKRIDAHGIAWHEKKLGQLFCDGSSRQIVDMLMGESHAAGVTVRLATKVDSYAKSATCFTLSAGGVALQCASLVIATGGPSIPKMGSSGWGYSVAKTFGLPIVDPRAGLVPFTLQGEWLEHARSLAGLSADVTASVGKSAFAEAMLFTHKGLSGPAMLQVSSYWQDGDDIAIDLLPQRDAFALLKQRKAAQPKQEISTVLAEWLPKRLVTALMGHLGAQGRLADLSHDTLKQVTARLHRWQLSPAGTEGYRTAEVTVGGVDTGALSSKTMEALHVPRLYFIGEVVDVTGWLGGYNFQWAWASGYVAGQVA